MRKLFRALTAASVIAAAGGTLIVGLSTASYADATTPPPWDTFTPTDGATYGGYSSPAGYGAVGGLTFYNSVGQQITGGSTSAYPFAAYAEGSVSTGGTKAQLYIAVPGASDPSGWTKLTLGNVGSNFPNSGAPSNLASSTLPLFTGTTGGSSLNSFVTANPDSGSPDVGYYQVREITSGTGAVGTEENAADILIDTTNSTWTLAYPTPAAIGTTTSLTTVPPSPASPQVLGTSVTITAQVTDADGSSPAGGTVQFQQNGAALGTPVTVASNGQAALSTSALALGSDSLTAVFTPATGTNYTTSTSAAVPYSVTPAVGTTTGLASSPLSPVSTGTPVTFTATVADADSSVPTGTVTFEDGGTPIAGESNVALTGNTATYTTSSLSIATHNLSAVYNPPAGFATSTGTESFTVNPNGDGTTTALTVNPSAAPISSNVTVNASVTDNASSTLTPTGTVTFYDNGASTSGTVTGSSVSLGSGPVPLVAGLASLTTAFTSTGAHNLVAVYNGAAPAFVGSTSSDVLFTALPAASSPDPQDIQVVVPAGSLLITTPYYGPTTANPAGNPFVLNPAVLDPATATFSASGQFGSAANPSQGVTITDTQAAGTGWVAFAQTSDFTNGSGGKINGQNLTLTGVTPSYPSGSALTAGSVVTNDVTDTLLGGANSYGVSAPGTDGLQGLSEGTTTPVAAHQFAQTASFAPGSGDGSVYIYGVLHLVAPSSTPSGTYSATLTFTIA